MKKALLLCSCLLFCAAVFARDNNTSQPSTEAFVHNKAQYAFIENKGQIIDQYNQPNPLLKFLWNGGSMKVQLKANSFSYEVLKTVVTKKTNIEKELPQLPNRLGLTDDSTTIFSHRVDVELVGANANPMIIAVDPSIDYINYYTTGTTEDGVRQVHHYNKVIYKDIYPSIDLEFVVNTKDNRPFKYNFVVKPGGDVNAIQLRYNGASNINLNEKGNITIATTSGDFEESIPLSFEAGSKETIAVQYKQIAKNTFGFGAAYYDHNEALVIDPWATYFGGSDGDWSMDVSTDNNGHVSICGSTESSNNIATVGAFQTIIGATRSGFLSRFNTNGQLIWATYFNGTCYLVENDLEENYILGGISDYLINGITTIGAWQDSFNGGNRDGFLAKFDTSGGRIWATYYGGNEDDWITDLKVDYLNNIVLTGWTKSTNILGSTGSYDTTYSGTIDAFVAKFNTNGQREWGTFFGGTGYDTFLGLCLDNAGNIYLAGSTSSTSDIAINAFQDSLGGGNTDGLLTKMNNLGFPIWSTYYGGSNDDVSYGIVIDSQSNVYFGGYTYSNNNIATPGSFQPVYYLQTAENGFIAKFNSIGSRVWGTYTPTSIYKIEKNKSNNFYVTGYAPDDSTITTSGAFQTFFGGLRDAYLSKFDLTGNRLWSTYYGGIDDDIGKSLSVDKNSNVYLTGCTKSPNIVYIGAYQQNYEGMWDGFLAAFDSNGYIPNFHCDSTFVIGSLPDTFKICPMMNDTIQLNGNFYQSGLVYQWQSSFLGSNSWTNISGATNPYYDIKTNSPLKLRVGVTCLLSSGNTVYSNTSTVTVRSIQSPTITPNGYLAICPNNGGSISLTASDGIQYVWSTGQQTKTITVDKYTRLCLYVIDTNGCLTKSDTQVINVHYMPSSISVKNIGSMSVCEPQYVPLVVNNPWNQIAGFGFQWNFNGVPINGATDSFYIASNTGSYSLTVSGGGTCTKTSGSKNITVKQQPTASFSLSGSPTFCTGSSVTFLAPFISGYSYVWLRNGVNNGLGNTKVVKLAGDYQLIAKLNGCYDTTNTPTTITVNTLPIAGISTPSSATICVGDSLELDASPTFNGFMYKWMNGTNNVANTMQPQIQAFTSGTYKVMVKDTNGCISKLSSTNVKVKTNSLPNASIVPMGSTTISSTGSVKLKSNPAAGYTFQWFKDGNPIINATNNQYFVTNGGSYTVAITKLGCTGVSTPVIVTQTTPKEEVSTITIGEGSFELSAYPNPVSEVLTVSISGIENVDGTIQVMDVMGKVVKSLSCKGEENQTTISRQLSTENWSSGVYFIRYKDSDGRTGTVKVVKE